MSEHVSERSSLLPSRHATLARYVAVEPLGTGGMAETFVARSVDPARAERVCLKRLRPALAKDAAQRAHFSDEVRVLARLCHPNVLCVLDAGVGLDGPFLVTELVEGVDLRRFLTWLSDLGEAMPEPIALRIVRDVADALAHAHAHGVVHRDVTPANVLLGRDGRVVLIDFGIARSDAQTERTRTGLVKGKAPYMVPEQALGNELDARTDLSALGVMLFEMLAGARPHDGASDVETVTNALRGLRRPLATHGLEHLLDALLSPKASHRPAEAGLVVRALDGATIGGAGELAAWVRAACETPARSTRTVDQSTRASGRARVADPATMPEQAIHTCVAPPVEDVEAVVQEVASGETVLDAVETSGARVRGWASEDEPPTVADAAMDPDGLDGATVVTPRFDDPAPASGEPPAGLEAPQATPRTKGKRQRRMAGFFPTVATLAGGLLGGATTGAAAAILLRCLL